MAAGSTREIYRIGSLVMKGRIHLPLEAIEKGGSVQKLVADASKYDLRTWLLLAFTCVPETGIVPHKYAALGNALGWLDADADSGRSRMTRILQRLQKHGLIELSSEFGKDRIRLLSLTGDGGAYGPAPFLFEPFPVEYFINGWDRVLDLPALGVLLISGAEAVKQRYKGAEGYWTKSIDRIHDEYGIAKSTFNKGKKTLGEFGLMLWTLNNASAHMGMPVCLFQHRIETLMSRPEYTPRYISDVTMRQFVHGRTGRVVTVRDRTWITEPKEGAVTRILAVATPEEMNEVFEARDRAFDEVPF